MRRFNVTGVCVPGKHYVADIGGKRIFRCGRVIKRGSLYDC